MGEYATINGECVKLGTCEDLYYCRYQDLADALKAGKAGRTVSGNLAAVEYLKPGWRFRFPFPDEDGRFKIGSYDPYDRGLLVSVPRSFLSEVEHSKDVCRSVNVGGVYNVNIMFNCPASPSFKSVPGVLGHSPLPERFPLEIVRQKTMESGELWTVCRCGWCGNMFRLPLEDAATLCAIITESYIEPEEKDGRKESAEFWQKVKDRIRAGYREVGEASALELVN